MKLISKTSIRVFILLLISTGLMLFFSTKPPLLADIDFSKAIFDEQHHLLRLTLSPDEKYRLYTPLSQMPKQLKEATLLQEDQYFYHHFGINPVALLKAIWATYMKKSRRMGASTITMQVARLRFAINSKTFSGKLWQIARALQLERHYTKDQILEAYLNLAPYGANIEGVGAASLIYFGQSVERIGLPEALTLSIIPQNPARRGPKNNHLQAIRNKLFVRWLRQHPEDKNKKALMNLPLSLQNSHSLPYSAPHFVNTVLSEKPKEHLIHTTLDNRLQTIIKRITHHYVMRKKRLGVANAAVLLVDTRNQEIKGLLGSADFFAKSIEGQIDGTNIKRSPGSTLKPFVYALALDQGLIHPNTVLKDVPHSFGSYNPENFDNDFMGPIKAKDALVLSRNIPAIYLASQLGKPGLHQLLEEAEISQLRSESYYGLALVLGGVELTMRELASLYTMLVNDGLWHPLRFRPEQETRPGKRLLSQEASFLVLDMLKDTLHPDFSAPNYPFPVSWKTGTSSGYRDAWTVGVFGPYVLVVWLGNFDNRANPAFIGKNLAAPLFFELIEGINNEKGPLPVIEKLPETMHLKRIPVCKASGMLPTAYCQDTEMTWFIPGKSPIKRDTIHREIAIDKQTGLRTCHIEKDTLFTIYEFWPTDLLTIFKQAGINRRVPPPFVASCDSFANDLGISPQITSPQTDLSYILNPNSRQKIRIPLTAIVDADVAFLYWFINDSYLAKTKSDQTLFWQAKAGKFLVRVVDDHGRSARREVEIKIGQ